MSEQLHYTTERRMRYLQEIGIPTQIGAIVDELRSLRAAMPAGYQGAQSFDSLLARIDAIKAEIPKSQ